MEVRKVNSVSNVKPAFKHHSVVFSTQPSFKAGAPSNASKKGWFALRRLSDQMKDINEIKNALIAAIGTGIIAPAIILVSPGKGDKEDKDKKFLQALRQPLSACLQLGFQVPATILINRYIDKLGYENNIKLFQDDKIGSLIPTEKYLMKNVKAEEIEELEAIFDKVIDGKSLKQELEDKIKLDYEEVGLEISDEKLAQRVRKDKKKFLEQKVAHNKFEQLKEQKIQDIIKNPDKYKNIVDIKDIDLVTEDYQNLAAHRFKNEYKKLETEANLSFFDRALRTMGFENKKLKVLKDKQNEFKKAKGLDLLKADSPNVFTSNDQKIRKFIESYQKDAEKYFGNKKFFISLLVNLFMVTASCFALNWIHPRVNKLIENRKAEKEDCTKKAEVK